MKYVIKGKDRNTKEVIECAEFRNKEPARFFFEKLSKNFGAVYDFWIESQSGTVKIAKSYKTKSTKF